MLKDVTIFQNTDTTGYTLEVVGTDNSYILYGVHRLFDFNINGK